VREQHAEEAPRLAPAQGQEPVSVSDPYGPEHPELHAHSLSSTLATRWCSDRPGSSRTVSTGRAHARFGPERPAPHRKGASMPLVNVKLIEGVFSTDQKQEIITRLTETMVDIEGEAMRPVTWVVVEEVNSGEWGIGGKPLSTQDVKDLQASGA
jgi:4-oxalocrotonate tautomerase